MQTLPHIIDQSAERLPTKEAFRCNDQGISYADLVTRSNQLAHALIDCGVGRGDRVGLYLPKSLHNPVAVFGVQKAGAAYVPLDPATPVARTTEVLRSCGIRHLVTDESRVPAVAELVEGDDQLHHLFGVDGADLATHAVDWTEILAHPITAPPVDLTPDDLAYVIFTSGSTGVPKGIVHSHATGLAYARMAAELYGLRDEDRLSNFPPLHFDQSTFDFFSGPLVGATTVIVGEQHQLVPASLSRLIETERLTVWYSVPHALIQLLLYGVLAERDLRSLRWVIYGGEPFPLKHLKALMDLWPHARFSNCYGPAETNQCTYHHVDRLTDEDVAADRGVPIGRVCDGVEARVVDQAGTDVPPGDRGELLISAPTTMVGYWDDPELTAAVLHRPDDDPSFRFYRTGDIVRYRDDGLLEFIGRHDRQVKTRGFRVELGEVEAVLMSHPEVQEAAVYPVADDDGITTLRASVILRPGAGSDGDDVGRHALSRLPRYAAPTAVDVRTTFPRTTSGKVDYRALAEEQA